MQPELPTPQLTPEQGPPRYSPGGEQLPPQSTPETGLGGGAERVEQAAEAAARASDAATAAVQATVMPTPVPVASDSSSATPVITETDDPLVADDVDLIEKEWVDRAKKIITETKEDPHKREQEVGKLQADYLRKRYGKELGVSD